MQLATFYDPLALALVGGGTALTMVLRTPAADLARALAALRHLWRARFSADPLLEQLAAQARIAKRHGVIALDHSVISDPDLAAGLAAIVDGAGPEDVAALMDERRQARFERHASAVDAWRGAAEAAPAMGMVGTLIGLAAMFAGMRDPQAIGGAMAVALLATLYGALLGNLLLQPVAQRLAGRARIEAFERSRLVRPLMVLAEREAPRLRQAHAA